MTWNFSFDWQALIDQLAYDPKNPLLFNNGFFVFFFAFFIVLYYAFRNHLAIRRYIFCAFSLYFFYKASGYFVGLVVISALVNFWLSHRIYLTRKKGGRFAYLLTATVFNLGLLFYFKYTNFFVELSNSFLDTHFNSLHILLPIGISFYTFENLSYTIDVYRGDFKPAKRFSEYLLFLSFFPKLMMGPIVRAHDFVPQINKPYCLSNSDFTKGFYLIVSGLIKKLIISDYITVNFVNYIFDDPTRYTGLENLLAVYGYAIVIYCDFSGYSDIAIGIAKWLGFDIPPNFLSPYQSRNITEFWRRWHISLSSWLKDYLYIPLGGNRKGSVATWLFTALFFFGLYFGSIHLLGLSSIYSLALCAAVLLILVIPALITRKAKGVTANMNLLTTMLLGGLWHGASFNFIIWGAMHGMALAVHKIWMLLTDRLLGGLKENGIYRFVMVLVTFHFVCFCWIFFKAANFDVAMAMIYQIYRDFNLSVWDAFYANYHTVLYMMAIGLLIHFIPDSWAGDFITKLNKVPLLAYVVVFFLFVVLYGFFKSATPVMPIYLQF
ncbi:MBOAT family O-acyltransferase [Olivibacter sitiensis]|uniref:MBOAT family O-acyltransferase n=1 Tax=Olivibacter sitiensis TaxID=376470 RepID=UPI000412642B|nr:MBOAT family O-acyltransferase [Olivibacter sitiensis]